MPRTRAPLASSSLDAAPTPASTGVAPSILDENLPAPTWKFDNLDGLNVVGLPMRSESPVTEPSSNALTALPGLVAKDDVQQTEPKVESKAENHQALNPAPIAKKSAPKSTATKPRRVASAPKPSTNEPGDAEPENLAPPKARRSRTRSVPPSKDVKAFVVPSAVSARSGPPVLKSPSYGVPSYVKPWEASVRFWGVATDPAASKKDAPKEVLDVLPSTKATAEATRVNPSLLAAAARSRMARRQEQRGHALAGAGREPSGLSLRMMILSGVVTMMLGLAVVDGYLEHGWGLLPVPTTQSLKTSKWIPAQQASTGPNADRRGVMVSSIATPPLQPSLAPMALPALLPAVERTTPSPVVAPVTPTMKQEPSKEAKLHDASIERRRVVSVRPPKPQTVTAPITAAPNQEMASPASGVNVVAIVPTPVSTEPLAPKGATIMSPDTTGAHAALFSLPASGASQ